MEKTQNQQCQGWEVLQTPSLAGLKEYSHMILANSQLNCEPCLSHWSLLEVKSRLELCQMKQKMP